MSEYVMGSDENAMYAHLLEVARLVAEVPRGPIYRMAKLLHARWQLGAAFLTCGNGGSASTAAHFACDLAKATRCEGRAPVRALCLNDSLASLTAWANDTTYQQALAEQLRSLGRPGDVLICISGSGKSPNVLQAAAYARRQRILVFALTGTGGGQLAPLADVAAIVPSDDMAAIEDVHLAICHALTKGLAGDIRL